jgi:hypothetical protein
VGRAKMRIFEGDCGKTLSALRAPNGACPTVSPNKVYNARLKSFDNIQLFRLRYALKRGPIDYVVR